MNTVVTVPAERIADGDRRALRPMLGPMSLADEIFPRPARRPRANTMGRGWTDSDGWTSSSVAFGDAARFLTENRAKFGASIDQVGLVVFFLQRHRVELAMKELLVDRGVEFDEIKRAGHSLEALWNACAVAVGASSKEWKELDACGRELVTLIHKHDPSSTRTATRSTATARSTSAPLHRPRGAGEARR